MSRDAIDHFDNTTSANDSTGTTGADKWNANNSVENKSMHCNNSQKKKQNKKDYSIPTRSKTYDTHTNPHNTLSHTRTRGSNAPHHLHLP